MPGKFSPARHCFSSQILGLHIFTHLRSTRFAFSGVTCSTSIKNFSAFARAYIEIHGVLDSHIIKGYQNRRTRLRIYGNLDALSLLNDVLPANPKKIQEINTQTGTTYCLNYQSKAEVCEILDWIDGSPRNESVWECWNKTLDCK